GIRDWSVTGVQTCALPISQTSFGEDGQDVGIEDAHPHRLMSRARGIEVLDRPACLPLLNAGPPLQCQCQGVPISEAVLGRERAEIGRASCRERVEIWVVAV